MLGGREIVTKVYRRSEVRVGTGYDDIFCRIVARKRHPLNARAYRKIIFLLLDPPGQRDIISIRREGIRIAEQAVEMRILLERIYVVVGIVDRPAMRIIVAIIQLQDGMFG